MHLATKIRNWDGKSVNAIMDIYAHHADDKDLLDRLVSLSGKTELETGATWLLKHRLENTDDQLAPALTNKLIALLPSLSSWEARLHCLQIFPFIEIPGEHTELILHFVLCCSQESNKFVRGWAYSGLHQLALTHPDYRDLARTVLETAEKTETAASVRVRLRRALKQGFPERQA